MYAAVAGAVNWYQRSGELAIVTEPPTVVPDTLAPDPVHVMVPAVTMPELLVGHVTVNVYAPLLVLNPSITTK